MSNSLDPVQARRFVRPDLGPNCLPRLSADDTGRQRVKRLWALASFYLECAKTRHRSYCSILQVNKAQTLPTSNQPIYMSHDHVIQSPARTNYERSRSLTPDPSMRSANYAQNPIYGRMGISPERPPPPQV